jgi:hypothetical protein
MQKERTRRYRSEAGSSAKVTTLPDSKAGRGSVLFRSSICPLDSRPLLMEGLVMSRRTTSPGFAIRGDGHAVPEAMDSWWSDSRRLAPASFKDTPPNAHPRHRIPCSRRLRKRASRVGEAVPSSPTSSALPPRPPIRQPLPLHHPRRFADTWLARCLGGLSAFAWRGARKVLSVRHLPTARREGSQVSQLSGASS